MGSTSNRLSSETGAGSQNRDCRSAGRRPIRLGVLALVSLLAATSLASVRVAAEPAMVDLGTLPNHIGSVATGINTAGLIVGGSLDAMRNFHAFRWEDGTGMIELPPLPADQAAIAFRINDAGQAVGESRCIQYKSHGVRWDGQTVIDLGTLPQDTNSSAFDINDTGAIVGVSYQTSYDARAVLWENGAILDLGILETAGQSEATALNDVGQIVGGSSVDSGATHAFLWRTGVMMDLGTLPGYSSSRASDINNAGTVVGESFNAALQGRAFLWKEGEGMTDLGTLPGYDSSAAVGINEAGHVVGFSFNDASDPYTYRAFLWRDGAITDLGVPSGGFGSVASDINEDGLIAGMGIKSNGAFHAFLWPPLALDPLVAEASASVPMAHVGVDVTFHCEVTGGAPPYAVAWEFGDGDRGSGETTTHAYRDAGLKTATCTVTDQDGSQTMAFAAVEVVAPLAATASANRTATNPGLPVTFAATATQGTGGYVFEWTFGDGSAVAFGGTVGHTYPSPGEYVAVVTARDSAGGTGLGTVTVRVAYLVVTPAPTVTSTETGKAVAFAAMATGGGGGYSFRWDFDDGRTGTGPSVAHPYDEPGRYTPKVTVTDEQGARNETLLPEITVREPSPVALAEAGGTSVWFLVLAVILGAMAAAVAVYLARRRRSQE